MGLLSRLDRTGHSEFPYGPENLAAVDAARKIFDESVGHGYRAWVRRSPDDDYLPTESFDPNAEEILISPALRGG